MVLKPEPAHECHHDLVVCWAANIERRPSDKNEMNRALGHFCAHIKREPHEDGEMSEMTLPSRHRIQNLSPGGLRSEAPHNTEFYEWMGKKVSFKPPRPENEPRTLA